MSESRVSLPLDALGINLPYNTEAEQAVIGAMLVDSSVQDDVFGILRPEYFYSKLSEKKPALLEEATKDAKLRAKGMLKATNNRVGKIRSVRMGVFQITPADSNEVSNWGINDSSTIEKKITAVANVVFMIK